MKRSEVSWLHWRWAIKMKFREQFLHSLDFRNMRNQERDRQKTRCALPEKNVCTFVNVSCIS
uniref:Uncharacterized protein n=1 Tax=Setaria italica TaxID=4555 RepID=K3Y3S8_SETIT